MATVEQSDICDLWHRSVQINRAAILGSTDEENYRPIHLRDDSATMFAGFVGQRYEPGKGVVLLGINPGGGGDAYAYRSPDDRRFYPLLQDFKNASSSDAMEAFERVNEHFAQILLRWNIWRIVEPALNSMGMDIDKTAYMNLVPYRTRQDKMPPVAARRASLEQIVAPALALLAPKAVVALGKKAGKIQDIWRPPPHIRLYCVPRTISDRTISEDAKLELERIKKELV